MKKYFDRHKSIRPLYIIIDTNTADSIQFWIDRCLGVYYPKKMRHDKFRRKTYLLIFLSWFFAYLPFLFTMSGLHNRHGFTCYQRKCSVLNLYDFESEKPQINVRMKTGVFTTAIWLLLLVILNGLIYRKLYVSIVNKFVIYILAYMDKKNQLIF